MRRDRMDRFETALNTFPIPAHPFLKNLPQQGGKLSRKACNELMGLLDVSCETLMIRLLPFAKIFSVAPISEFQVGAVALAGEGSADTEASLYLGANMEFKHLALTMSLHAEQAAVMNAWHQGANCLKTIATSEPPCGHCRQFLNEFFDAAEMVVLVPGPEGNAYHRNRLSDILPMAIAPHNLGNDSCLTAPSTAIRKLRLTHHSDDPVVKTALSAAEASYAPYTGNLAGSAVQTIDNGIISGRYAESVAFNPSVSSLHSAILRLNQMTIEDKHTIERVVLVEKPTRIRQKDLVEMLMRSWAPGIELEYYIAKEEEG
jgi:cytidine deaminase